MPLFAHYPKGLLLKWIGKKYFPLLWSSIHFTMSTLMSLTSIYCTVKEAHFRLNCIRGIWQIERAHCFWEQRTSPSQARVGLFQLQPNFRIHTSFRNWESNTKGLEMQFECDFLPFRIQSLTQSHLSVICSTIRQSLLPLWVINVSVLSFWACFVQCMGIEKYTEWVERHI